MLPCRNALASPYDNFISIEIFGDTLRLPADPSIHIDYQGPLTEESLFAFHRQINDSRYEPLIEALSDYRQQHHLNDWLYYQLIRKTAEQIAPKADNYYRYTLYKWFLMVKSGYDATLNIHNDQLLFYVYSQDEVFNIPLYINNGRQYVCLNIHDYLRASQQFHDYIVPVELPEPAALSPFSYKVTRLPEFNTAQYTDKEIRFPYANREFHFTLKVNPQVARLFTNYPVVDFDTYFNIPLSRQTYQSLVPMLQRNLKGLKVKDGVDYLMRFTRYAFLYEDDQAHFGREKRMAPEETLLASASDCDDRAALFFYLVKEIYNLPMIALVYQDHITVAVEFKKPYGKTVNYQGRSYSICDPTPQGKDLSIGQATASLKQLPYEIVYAYNPH